MNFSSLTFILTEANLYNKQDLIYALMEVLRSNNVTDPNIVNWFRTQYVNWYLSSTDDKAKDIIYPHEYKAGEPEWTKKENIVDFRGFSPATIEHLNHIIDYFTTLSEIDLKKIYKEPYEIILKKIDKWETYIKVQQTKKQEEESEGVDYQVVFSFNDGFKIVKLISEKAYTIEGNTMGHCVGTADYFQRKDVSILSLRDKSNKPHVTLEIRNNDEIYQIKGKENKAPIKQYWVYIKKFISENKLVVKLDGDNIGLVKWEDNWWDLESNDWKEVYNTKILPLQTQRIQEILSRIVVINNEKIIGGYIDLSGLYLKKLPNLSNVATGDFNCSDNQLTSLQGCPKEVRGNFYCDHNQLISLQGSPEKVGGDFNCDRNQLTSLQGSPEEVRGDFYCRHNQLISLQGCPKEVRGHFYCTHNPIKFTEHNIKNAMQQRALSNESTKFNKLYEHILSNI